MDFTSIFLFCLISLVIGAVLMILVQYYAFIKYFNGSGNANEQRNRSFNEKYQLPDVSKFTFAAITMTIESAILLRRRRCWPASIRPNWRAAIPPLRSI